MAGSHVRRHTLPPRRKPRSSQYSPDLQHESPHTLAGLHRQSGYLSPQTSSFPQHQPMLLSIVSGCWHTPLPVRVKQRFGTVIPNQRRVHLQIVESGITPEQPYARLGACVIEQLPENLPVSSPIEVTLRYDEQARVHVEARDETSGRMAMAVIVREENRTYLTPEQAHAAEVALQPEDGPLASGTDPVPAPDVPVVTVIPGKHDAKPQAVLVNRSPKAAVAKPEAKMVEAAKPETKKPEATKAAAKPPSPEVAEMLERAQRPILLCNYCGEPLNAKGKCTGCGRTAK